MTSEISYNREGSAAQTGPFQHILYGLEAVALSYISNPSPLTRPLTLEPMRHSQLQLNIETICLNLASLGCLFTLLFHKSVCFSSIAHCNAALLNTFTKAHTWEQNSTSQGILLLAKAVER